VFCPLSSLRTFGRSLLGWTMVVTPTIAFAQELLPDLELPPQEPVPMVIPADGNQFGEALLRGPVHEAFAELHQAEPTPGVIIVQRPPDLIEESPPEMRPEGRNIEWVPGYWAFDEEASEFLWISGIWRQIPPGFRWLPGYWLELENGAGFQWISGTWVPVETTELQYLPDAPPASLERGPAGVAPSVEHLWVPGHWTWQERTYAWRPGFWSLGHEHWVWIPARYQWTPRGYVFCRGHWDFPLVRRGWLFSPYRFHRPFFDQPRCVFTPQVLVAIDLLPQHLWVRPSHCHYYFGDYYDDFAGHGFVPWHHWAVSGRAGVAINVNFNNPRSFYCGYDPLFHHFSRTTVIQNIHVTNVNQQIHYYNDFDQRFRNLQVQRDHRPSRNFRDFQASRSGQELPNHELLQSGLGRTMEQHRQLAGRERIQEVAVDRSANQAQLQIARQLAVARQDIERRGRRPAGSSTVERVGLPPEVIVGAAATDAALPSAFDPRTSPRSSRGSVDGNRDVSGFPRQRPIGRSERERSPGLPAVDAQAEPRQPQTNPGVTRDGTLGRDWVSPEDLRNRTRGATAPERSVNRRLEEQRGVEARERREAVDEAMRRGDVDRGVDRSGTRSNGPSNSDQGWRIRPGATEAELRSWVENHQRRIGTDPQTARGMAERLVPPGSVTGNGRNIQTQPPYDSGRGRGLERGSSRELMPGPQRNDLPNGNTAPGRSLGSERNFSNGDRSAREGMNREGMNRAGMNRAGGPGRGLQK
jgi:hypothetical protein